jgi:hypothetical protein
MTLLFIRPVRYAAPKLLSEKTTRGERSWIIRAPREDQWAPGYYSTLFEDPDGIRLELDHVPGWGLLG